MASEQERLIATVFHQSRAASKRKPRTPEQQRLFEAVCKAARDQAS